MRVRLWFACVLSLSLTTSTACAADAAGLQFFEQKIRPVLVQHCYSCHSAETPKGPKGSLLLDSKPGILAGGDSGPAILAGKINESPIIKALRGDEIPLMPPKGKLPDDVIEDFRKWLKMGAPDPRDGKVVAKTSIDLEAGRKFWSLQPLRPTTPPTVKDTAWGRAPADAYILAGLEAKNVPPTRDADRATLLRRVTIDLTGLPPTPTEVDAFLNDKADDQAALATVVDRLLASSAYGERWGRHWLDVARYADSNGKDENLTFYESFRYRDYVIAAYNKDKPYDQFIREQIAGDLMGGTTPTERDERLTASGFLILGPKVLADRDHAKRRMDVIDEQIDTVGKAFMGLTLGCARCHDHKFDPVPTADYYALAGIFNSTRTLDSFKLGNPIVSGWTVRPLGGAEGEAKAKAQIDHQKQIKALDAKIKKVKEELKGSEDKASMRSSNVLVGIVVDDSEAKVVGQWKPSTFTKPYVGTGYLTDDKAGKGEKSVIYTPKLPKAGEYDVQISYTPGGNRANNVPVTIQCADGEKNVVLDETKPVKLDGLFVSVGKFKFEAGNKGSVTIGTKGTEGYVLADAVRFVPKGALENDAEMAMGVPADVRTKLADAQTRLKELEAEEKKLKATAPTAPMLVMAPRDEEKVGNAKINIRGNPHQLGAEVERGFLSVVPLPARPKIAAGQSGRRELAEWLTDPKHPLVARVYVNRVWLHLFGEGIVRTVDNFGIQGEKPTHPELLDALATQFVADGWSTKKLVRSLILSRAYRQASVAPAATVQADPENRLWSRANRRRVEAEVIRDTMLTVAGTLDRTLGGTAVGTLGERVVSNDSSGGVKNEGTRRSVYLPVLRTLLPQALDVFDFADPDVSTGRRDATTVSTQALYLMNSPFVLDQARTAATKLLAQTGDDHARLTTLFRTALGRLPSENESSNVLRFVADYKSGAKTDPRTEAWTAVCLAVFGSTEFRFME
jgi:cytochrome c553